MSGQFNERAPWAACHYTQRGRGRKDTPREFALCEAGMDKGTGQKAQTGGPREVLERRQCLALWEMMTCAGQSAFWYLARRCPLIESGMENPHWLLSSKTSIWIVFHDPVCHKQPTHPAPSLNRTTHMHRKPLVCPGQAWMQWCPLIEQPP